MNKGFSLVELIVVIAIMAILVGVAVPVYTSYINKANEAVDEQYVESLKSAINTAAVDVASGLTKIENVDDNVVPTSVTITNGEIEATGENDAEANEFEAIFKTLITPEADGQTYTFTLVNGVIVEPADDTSSSETSN